MSKKNQSVEPIVANWGNRQIEDSGYEYGYEQNSINKIISDSLKDSFSKSGGNGNCRPDAQMLITNGIEEIPVMIEYKGKKRALEKLTKNNLVSLKLDNNEFDYKSINNYAVNGACYYSYVILENSNNYDKSLSVGVNGYEIANGEINYEIKIYIQTRDNSLIPVLIGEYSDLSLLNSEHSDLLFNKINESLEDPQELHRKSLEDEQRLEGILKELNEHMHKEAHIEVGKRINIVASCIMAALGVKENNITIVSPLLPDELVGSNEEGNTDGDKIVNKIKNFLSKKDIPLEKQKDILRHLKITILDRNLSLIDKDLGMSPLKSTYKLIYEKVIPAYLISGKLDFTGKLFNVMNDWVDVPDGGENDVVLTPRYITELMVKLCEVNMNSYVWDWALGSAGFLISAMNEMLKDAKKRCESPRELYKKERNIREVQLLGVEKLTSIYVLAVLNMILMGDGSSNIINQDSLRDFDGTYSYNDRGEFPADVFLLNPPYSAEGNGMIFVEKALNKMKGGKACVIIQDSAGSGKAVDINKRILKNNKLLASIKMPIDLFKASVQTSIYLFEVNKPHNKKDKVKFIDFRNDGYTRTNRKKAKINLRDSDHARERYEELVEVIIRNDIKNAKYLKEGETYFEDTIDTDSGADWNYEQHQIIDITPTEEDFMKVIGDYLSWEVSQMLGGYNG